MPAKQLRGVAPASSAAASSGVENAGLGSSQRHSLRHSRRTAVLLRNYSSPTQLTQCTPLRPSKFEPPSHCPASSELRTSAHTAESSVHLESSLPAASAAVRFSATPKNDPTSVSTPHAPHESAPRKPPQWPNGKKTTVPLGVSTASVEMETPSHSSSTEGVKTVSEWETEMVGAALLDASQRAAVSHDPNTPLLLEAGPGSGKTQTMVYRLAYLLQQQNIQPYQVLVLCFTRQAAEALRQRLQVLLLQQQQRHTSSNSTATYCNANSSSVATSSNPAFLVKLKTLHAFGLESLRRFGVMDAETEVLDSAEQLRLVKRLVEQYALHTKGAEAVESLFEYISRVKRSTKWSEGQLLANRLRDEAAAAAGPQRHSATSRFSAHSDGGSSGGISSSPLVNTEGAPFISYPPDKQDVHLFALYQQALQEDHAVDFDDLQYAFYNLLKPIPVLNEGEPSATQPSPVAVQLQSDITHILVDEFQDLNEIQFEILTQLAGTACRVTCVGDPHQCIYGWRGAIPHIFARWSQRFPQTVQLSLAMNYRSTPALVTLSNAFVKGRGQVAASRSHAAEEREGGGVRPAVLQAVERQESSHSPPDQEEPHLPGSAKNRGSIPAVEGCQRGIVIECPLEHVHPSLLSRPSGGRGARSAVGGMDLTVYTLPVCQAARHVVEHILRSTNATASAPSQRRVVPLVYGDIAVLCRTKKTVKEFVKFFEEHRIPVQELKSAPGQHVNAVMAFTQSLISYLRCAFQNPSNEDVQSALTLGPLHRISERQQKGFFFDLQATAAMIRYQELQQEDVEAKHALTEPLFSPSQVSPLATVSNYFASSSVAVAPLRAPTRWSYYSILQQAVYHQFDPVLFPKLKVSKPNQKVLKKFIQCTAFARDVLYRPSPAGGAPSSHSATPSSSSALFKSSLFASMTVVREVLQYVLAEAGFDSETASNVVVKQPLNKHRGKLYKRQGKESPSGLPPTQRHRGETLPESSFAAALVAEVASACGRSSNPTISSTATTATSMNEIAPTSKETTSADLPHNNGGTVHHEKDEMEPQQQEHVCLTRKLMEACDAVEVLLHAEEMGREAALATSSIDSVKQEEVEDHPRRLHRSSGELFRAAFTAAPSPPILLRRVLDEFTDFVAALEEERVVPEAPHPTGAVVEPAPSALRPFGKVTVGTAHSAKGLEWPAVILPHCWEGEYPVYASNSSSTAATSSGCLEERRVFYVAMTRAKTDLFFLTIPHRTGRKASDEERSAEDTAPSASREESQLSAGGLRRSPYLAELAPHLVTLRWEDLRQQQLEAVGGW